MIPTHGSADRTPHPFTLSLLVALGACAAPAAEPLDLDGISVEIATRGATPAQVADALQLADLRALPFERPVLEDEPSYDHGAFWQASALAFNGELRAARRRWAEASAFARSAGAPDAAELEVEATSFDADQRDTWIALTFDVLGLLDAGRSAAARELSRAEARTAWAQLESAAWTTHIAVDRARVELGSTLAKVALLTDLLASSRASLARADLLLERGRLSVGEYARLRGMVGEVAHELHKQQVNLARDRRGLADVAGLPPSAPPLDRPTRETLEDLIRSAEWPRVPEARELFDRSPLLRRSRLEFAVAEAMLRDEVARTRPGLRLGPAVQITSDETLPGGVLVLDLPHASALSGRVEAARQARERVREDVEEKLRASLARIAESRSQYETVQSALAQHAFPREAETSTAWRAARARFDVDPTAAEEVGMALRDRAMALVDLYEMRAQVVLVWLELQEVIGPEPRPLPGDEALAADRTSEARR